MILHWLTKIRILPCGSNETLNMRVHAAMTAACLVEAALAVAAAVYHAACTREHARRRREQKGR